jgi:predicted dienelactone hydrolase
LGLFVSLAPDFAQAGTHCETHLQASGQRRLPIAVHAAQNNSAAEAPVVIFSHGLGGNNEGAAAWTRAWTQAGFTVVKIQHPGSDSTVLDAALTPSDRRATLLKAANVREFIERLRDVKFLIDRIEKKDAKDCGLDRLDAKRIAMSGHSFGGQTTQALIGQRFDAPGAEAFREPRLRAAVIFSPNPPRGDAARAKGAFDDLKVPVLAVTGTEDGAVLGLPGDAMARRAVFEAMPPGAKAQLVFAGGDHWTFAGGGRGLPREETARDREIYRVAGLASAAFLKIFLGPEPGTAITTGSLKSWEKEVGAQLSAGDLISIK